MAVNILDDLKKNKPILGMERTLKRIMAKKVSKVYVSSNSHYKENFQILGKSMGVEVFVINETSKELGVLCKKPFSVSVISFE